MSSNKTCSACGMIGHEILQCPQVKAVEYYPDGTIKRIELVREQPLLPRSLGTVNTFPPTVLKPTPIGGCV